MPQSLLFTPLRLRGVEFRNRVAIAPMCQYSAEDGTANDWHFVHLGRFALGGAGLVIVEATGVEPEGRITYGDLGLWNETQERELARIAGFLKSQGAAAGIQLAHAGRKASTRVPWNGGGPVGPEHVAQGEQAWPVVAPSAQPFTEGWFTPHELTVDELARIKASFVTAAERAERAGFDVVEVHAAHGYLLHQFLSPTANERTDAYGGDREGRMRFPLEVVEAVRAVWPEFKPLFVRISAVDETALTIEDSVAFARELKARGVDLVHVSSGGIATGPGTTPIRAFPGYQVAHAAAVRAGAEVPTAAVGLINDADQAEAVLQRGKADLIALGRAALDDPNWALHARLALEGPEPAFDSAPLPVGYALAGREKALARAQAD